MTWVHIEGSTKIGAVSATTNFGLLTELIGSTGNAVKATTNGALLTELIGSTGNAVKATTDGAMLVGIMGSTGTAVRVDVAGALLVSGVSVTIGDVLPLGTTAAASGTVGLTSDSTQLAAQAAREFWLQNDPANVVDVLLGASSNCIMHLEPGDSATLGVANKNLIWAKAASSTATLNWFALTS